MLQEDCLCTYGWPAVDRTCTQASAYARCWPRDWLLGHKASLPLWLVDQPNWPYATESKVFSVCQPSSRPLLWEHIVFSQQSTGKPQQLKKIVVGSQPGGQSLGQYGAWLASNNYILIFLVFVLFLNSYILLYFDLITILTNEFTLYSSLPYCYK